MQKSERKSQPLSTRIRTKRDPKHIGPRATGWHRIRPPQSPPISCLHGRTPSVIRPFVNAPTACNTWLSVHQPLSYARSHKFIQSLTRQHACYIVTFWGMLNAIASVMDHNNTTMSHVCYRHIGTVIVRFKMEVSRVFCCQREVCPASQCPESKHRLSGCEQCTRTRLISRQYSDCDSDVMDKSRPYRSSAARSSKTFYFIFIIIEIINIISHCADYI